MRMDERKVKLLKQIADGVTIHEPFYRRGKEMMEFQETARLMLELSEEGLIGKCYTQVYEIAGVEYYDMVMTYTGITEKGRGALAEAIAGEPSRGQKRSRI